MSNTIRNRKLGHHLFSNSWTNRERKIRPYNERSWEELAIFQMDGQPYFWLNKPSQYQRKQSHKALRAQSKVSLKQSNIEAEVFYERPVRLEW